MSFSGCELAVFCILGNYDTVRLSQALIFERIILETLMSSPLRGGTRAKMILWLQLANANMPACSQVCNN